MISESMKKKAWDIKNRLDRGEKVTDEEFEYANNYLKILKCELEEAKKQFVSRKRTSLGWLLNITDVIFCKF